MVNWGNLLWVLPNNCQNVDTMLFFFLKDELYTLETMSKCIENLDIGIKRNFLYKNIKKGIF